MEPDFKCNSFKCRKPLPSDVDAKAVVTTCSHIFCVDCANELFSASRICPACEASLTEPDDVVICSLRPTNDYKTTVLSGLTPVTVLEICGRAISFWNYQVTQEYAFQQIIFKNANEKMAQMQKQLDNVIREANGQLSLMNDKVAGLERDLELERRRNRDLQEVTRDRDKEYQKLKEQLDKYKRKALLGTGSMASAALNGTAAGLGNGNGASLDQGMLNPQPQHQQFFGGGPGQMRTDNNTLQSTPARHRHAGQNEAFQHQVPQQAFQNPVHASRSRPRRLNTSDMQNPVAQDQRGYRTISPSESMQSNPSLGVGHERQRQHRQAPRPANSVQVPHQQPFGSTNFLNGVNAQPSSRRSGSFLPAGFAR